LKLNKVILIFVFALLLVGCGKNEWVPMDSNKSSSTWEHLKPSNAELVKILYSKKNPALSFRRGSAIIKINSEKFIFNWK